MPGTSPAPFLGGTASSATLASINPVTATPLAYPSIQQVFRFDLSKEWVFERWARKSTGPTDVGLVAVRVQLITGTSPNSLAGALTYFFNSQNQVEHISFRGRTGDPAPLAQLITRAYQLQPVSAPTGEKVYQLGDGDGVQSELRIRSDAVVKGGTATGCHQIELELARPGSPRYLPPRGTGLQIEPQAASGAPDSSSKGIGGSVKSALGSYFESARFATPQEEAPQLWKRWPN